MIGLVFTVMLAASHVLMASDSTLIASQHYECPNGEYVKKSVYQTDKGILVTLHWVNGDGTLLSIQFSPENSPETVTLSQPGQPLQNMTFEELKVRYPSGCDLPGAPGERA